jgi:hypothetical protein
MTGTFTHTIKGYAYLALFKRPQPGSTMSRRQLAEEEPAESEDWPVDVLFPSDHQSDALLLCKACGATGIRAPTAPPERSHRSRP